MLIHNVRFQWELGAFFAALALGALFHFTYAWSGDSPGVAWFSATNESVWEHQKLLVWPCLLLTLGMSLWQLFNHSISADEDVWGGRAVGLLTGLVFIPVVFYAYTWGDFDRAILAVDLVTFVVAIALIGIVAWFLRRRPSKWLAGWGLLIWTVTLALFTIFSYIPPSDTGLWAVP
jgi:hypothetical protein